MITDTMDIRGLGRKDRHLNTLEKYYIYKISRNSLHMTDTQINTHNLILQTLHEFDDR
jgi:hypothetical protein